MGNPSTTYILPGCPSAPKGLIGGLTRQERLRKTLEQRGFRIVEKSDEAELKIKDCHLPFQGEDLHLCEVGLQEVERRLLQSLKKPIWVDGVVCFFMTRHLSRWVTRWLMNTHVAPNQVTYIALFLSLLSGLVVTGGTYIHGLLGALLLQVQTILDCVDGELARLKFQGSRMGEWLDTIADDLASLSFLGGCLWVVTIPWVRWLGIAGVVSFLLSQAILYFALITLYHSGDLFAFSWETKESGANHPIRDSLRLLFRYDFLCFAVLCFAILGHLEWAVVYSSVTKIRRLLALIRILMIRGLSSPVMTPLPSATSRNIKTTKE